MKKKKRYDGNYSVRLNNCRDIVLHHPHHLRLDLDFITEVQAIIATANTPNNNL